MSLRRLSLCALCVFSVLAADSSAAPPVLAPLFPAGGQRGTSVEVTTPSPLWSSNPSLTVEPAKEKGKYSIKVAADAVPGVHWFRCLNTEGASNLRPFIVGTLPEVQEKEPNDEPKAPQDLTGSCVINGKLAKSGDTDCYRIAAKKGQTLVASLVANQALKSPMDGVLQIVSTDGFLLEENHDFHGLDPQVMYTVPRDGTYLVRVFAFPSQPDTTIRFSGADTYIYRLTITTDGFLDHTIPLAIKPDARTVEPRGWNLPNDVQTLTAAADGTVFHPKLASAFQAKLDPKATTHRIERPGGEVMVPFTGKKGQPVAISVASRSLGLPVDAVIRVLDREKKVLVRAEPPKLASDTTLSFTPPADGEYTIAVSDLYARGGFRFAFALRVGPVEPDYSLTLTTDRFTIPTGKPLEIPIKIVRAGGFSKPIEVAAEGLPNGVTFSIKPPGEKPDPNLVTVILSAAKVSSGSAFKLIGRVKNDSAFTRVAAATLPDFDTTTESLWVNVSDAPSPEPKKKK